ncbi:MAG: hypothetical protein IJM84_02565, partial [Bacteroidaceae bacterium]|nr:hypothetical protein [Bacteroidaceae bacterium]
MKITIINHDGKEKRYTRVELEEFIEQLRNGTYRHTYLRDFTKEVCFAAEWQKLNGILKMKACNSLVLLSLENLSDLATAEEYKERAALQPYTLLCFLGHDGHSLHIVCRYDVTDVVGDLKSTTNELANLQFAETALLNAFRKLHYIYSSQLGTQVADHEPTFSTSCKACYDPQPYFNPDALPITVLPQEEETPKFRSIQEDISDYNDPQEIPGVSLRTSRMRRFHDCLNTAIETCREMRDDDLFQVAVLEHLADGCRQMGLPQAWAAHVATFIPLLGGLDNQDTIRDIFNTAYLKDTLKTIPMKFTRPSALLA